MMPLDEFAYLEGMDLGLIVLDVDLTVYFWNPWLAKQTNISADQAQGLRLGQLVSVSNGAALQREIDASLRHGSSTYLDLALSGYLLPVPRVGNMAAFPMMQQSVHVMPLGEDHDGRVLVMIHDITAVKTYQMELEQKMGEVEGLNQQLMTDAQTGLATRAKLMCDLETTDQAKVALISIDNFRDINALYGFAACTIAIRDFAGMLLKSFEGLPYNLRVYKLVGNEFALLADKDFLDQRFIAFTQAMANQLNSASFRSDDLEVPFAISVGVSLQEGNLMRHANLAMLNAQGDHTSCFRVYDDSLDNGDEVARNMEAVNEVKHALIDKRFVPYYQAICDCKTHQVVKFESLIRMVRSDGKIWSPIFFLDTSKRARLYPYLTREMIKQTVRYFRDTPYCFTLNLSVEDILNAETVVFLKRQLKTAKISGRVTLELLEDEGIEKLNEVTEFLDEMRAMGCKVAIDDFGSGYSNFDYLTKLNVDYIKIDGSIIKKIHQDKNARIVAGSIVHFAKQLGIKVVAEFVCSAEIAQVALELDIDLLQGYHLSEPVPDVTAVIERLGFQSEQGEV
ncbi:MAG: EAL domain-containing protein [Mariprofundales bacterium]|nr:EAL domain-containing protein [Mariprofundales bacterium]